LLFANFFRYLFKVEKILKGSLDSIPSVLPSVKTQIMGGKVCLRCKGKRLLCVVNKLLKNKKFVDISQQYFALLRQIAVQLSALHLMEIPLGGANTVDS
jgi:hypothetical protein